MAVLAKWYGQAAPKMLNKEIDWDSDDIKVMLCTSAYVPDQDNHQYKDSVTDEVVGTGYTAGGQSLASKSISYDPSTNVTKLDAYDVSWANSSVTARYAVIYDNTPATDATKPLLGYVDFGEDKVSSNGTFTIQWHADGIFTVTAS